MRRRERETYCDFPFISLSARKNAQRTSVDSLSVSKAPPVGLQQSSKTLGNSNETDLVVTPVVTLDARTAELMAIWDQLDGGQREQALEWLRSKTKYASD